MVWQNFKGSFLFTFVVMAGVGVWGYEIGGIAGALEGMFIALILSVLEVSLSFDNAIVNASILKKMDEIWQRRFLTWGMVVAVFGMRLVFPILIVALTTGSSLAEVGKIAFLDPDEYARRLTDAHALISAFGGMFLLMVFLKFFLDEEKEVHWIKIVEEKLAKFGKLESIEMVLSLLVLVGISTTVANHEKLAVLTSGILGIVIYELMDSLSRLLEESERKSVQKGLISGGLALFLYLEMLDASFSFDGVIGAFAITKDIVLITGGLSIGAMFVRSLTIFLVRKGTLAEYIFLEHGAFWAIGALAVIMLISVNTHIPEVVTGLIGAIFIATAVISSIRHKRENG